MSLGRSIATVGSFTLLSRIVGFVRDIVLSAVLGSGPIADAFIVAFKLPNLFRRLFAEGAFSAAFVPLFARELQGEGREAALVFARQAHACLLMVLVPFSLLHDADHAGGDLGAWRRASPATSRSSTSPSPSAASPSPTWSSSRSPRSMAAC